MEWWVCMQSCWSRYYIMLIMHRTQCRWQSSRRACSRDSRRSRRRTRSSRRRPGRPPCTRTCPFRRRSFRCTADPRRTDKLRIMELPFSHQRMSSLSTYSAGCSFSTGISPVWSRFDLIHWLKRERHNIRNFSRSYQWIYAANRMNNPSKIYMNCTPLTFITILTQNK